MTAQDVVNAALTLIGQLGPGRTAGLSESAVAFSYLQNLVDSWGTERVYIFEVRFDSYALTAGQQSYTIGPTGTFAATRPMFVERANMVVTAEGASFRSPLNLLTHEGWSQIRTLADQSTVPQSLYDDYAIPNSTLYLYPAPSTNSHLELYTWQALQAFAALTDTFSMPPGYFRALSHALALEIAPVFRMPVTRDLDNAAQMAKAAIVARNLKMPAPAQDVEQVAPLPHAAPPPPPPQQ